MSDIIIAFSDEKISQKFRQLLFHIGRDAITASGGNEVLRYLNDRGCGLIICQVRLRDMDYTEILRNKPCTYQVLLIDTPHRISYRKEEDVVALTMPVTAGDFLDTCSLLLRGIEERYGPGYKPRKKRSPEEQKTIDEAKAVLMNRNHLTEPEAFRYIQKNSMDTGRTMLETAEMVLTLFR